MSQQPDPEPQAYGAWTVVDVVFRHLVDQGLAPTLGSGGNPSEPAAALLRALGIRPAPAGDPRISRRTHAQLAELRARMMDDP